MVTPSEVGELAIELCILLLHWSSKSGQRPLRKEGMMAAVISEETQKEKEFQDQDSGIVRPNPSSSRVVLRLSVTYIVLPCTCV